MRAGERASAVGKPARLFVDVVVFAVAIAAASVQHEAAGWELQSSGAALTCGLVRASNTGT